MRQCVSDCVKILAVRTALLASHSHRFCPADIGTSVTHLKVLMCFAIVIVSMTIRSRTLDATEPLHKRIDSLVVAHQGFRSAAAPATDDASFLRRIHLDLTGSIPTAQQARDFLADSAADKRTQLIDKLLDSPQYARRMQVVFDVMLMERRASKHIKAEQWEEYLWDSFRENKSWMQLSTEMLTADGTDEKTRPAARFMLDRELNVDEVTRDVGRMFLGRDLQCAQCHDHPAIDDYLQRHYYGLAAFIKRSFVFKDPKTKESSIGEKADGEIEFTSVFTSEKDKTAPRVLDAEPIADPPGGDELYKVKPAKDVRSVPLYSRRLQLAQSLTDPANVAFRFNIANRVWALMMGRGLVEPVDMWHADNLPTHPELLSLLAESFLEHEYDLKYLVRQLALTDAYQRSSQYTPQAAGHDSDDATAETADYAVAILKPLSPEQLAWSMMKASGLAEQQLASLISKQEKAEEKAEQETEKKAGEKSEKESEEKAEKQTTEATVKQGSASDPVWQEKSLNKALCAHVATFAGVFGSKGVQQSRFDASADQALFLRNGDLIQRWVALKNGLSDRLAAMKDTEVAEEFYLSVFSRMPSSEESKLIEEMLEPSDDRKADIRQLVWAGLASAEFRFNH